jgi:hypothetical protein
MSSHERSRAGHLEGREKPGRALCGLPLGPDVEPGGFVDCAKCKLSNRYRRFLWGRGRTTRGG